MARMSAQPGRAKRMGLVALTLSVLCVSCTSSETSVTGPSTTRCGVTVGSSMETAPASGGSGTITIGAARDCTWAASNGAPWVVITSATSGQGDGSVTFRVAANSDPVGRRTTIDVNDKAISIAQEAAPCVFAVSPTSADIPASGGRVTIQMRGHSACSWSASSDAGWARITSPVSGQGDGSIHVDVEANGGAARSARVVSAGMAVAIAQASGAPAPPPPPPPPPACSYSIQPTGQTLPNGGGTGTIDVTTTANSCAWTAKSNVGWILITAGATGTGNGPVTFTVGANDGGSRTGTLSVAGHTFTVAQAGASCSYSINPSSAAVVVAGETITTSVATGPSCAWSSASHAGWIMIVAGGSGPGPGTVTLNIAANQGAARTGTATIAAQTFTVTQAAAPCTFSITPSAQTVPGAGGTGTVGVTAGEGCTWTAVSNATDWLTITGGTPGSGNGSVSFSAAINPGPQRTGTLTIAGQTFTVTQPPQ
jgi:hypothetical protein